MSGLDNAIHDCSQGDEDPKSWDRTLKETFMTLPQVQWPETGWDSPRSLLQQGRLKEIAIGEMHLPMFLSGGFAFKYDDLPADAEVVGVHYDVTRRAFVLRVAHASFEPVEPGMVIPVLRTAITAFNAAGVEAVHNRLRDDAELRGALARAYCTERNQSKVLDPDLIEDMVFEIMLLLTGVSP